MPDAVTDVLIEHADLDNGIVMTFALFGPRLRAAFDPLKISESEALDLLRWHCPTLRGAVNVIHRTASEPCA